MNKLLVFLLFLCSYCTAQPHLIWEKSIGTSANEVFQFIIPTNDGGYLAGGEALNAPDGLGGSDGWLTKVDAQGNLQWQKYFGGDQDDQFWDATPTNDGNFLLVGTSRSYLSAEAINRGWEDYWVVKINPDGELLWQKTYGGNLPDIAKGVELTASGGFVIAGYSQSSDLPNNGEIEGQSDAWIVRLNPDGEVIWSQVYGGFSKETISGIAQSADGKFTFCGTTNSQELSFNGETEADFWAFQIAGNGELLWSNSYGQLSHEEVTSITHLSDGGYAIAGNTLGFQGFIEGQEAITDFFIVKTDSEGQLVWEKHLSEYDYNKALAIAENVNGEIITLGYSDIAAGQSELMISSFYPDGTIRWKGLYGGFGSEYGNAMHLTNEGFFVAAGQSNAAGGGVSQNFGGRDGWIIGLQILPNVELNDDFEICRESIFELNAYDDACLYCTYEWSDGNTDSIRYIAAQNDEIYSVTITDINGLSVTDDVSITVNSLPQVDIIGASVIPCRKQVVPLSLDINNCTDCSFFWENFHQNPDREILAENNAVYSVTVTDNNGCTATDSHEIVVQLSGFELDFNIQNICGSGLNSVEVLPTGGVGSYSYNWSNNATTANLNNLNAGTYSVTVNDGVCDLSEEVYVGFENLYIIDNQVNIGGKFDETATQILPLDSGGYMLLGTTNEAHRDIEDNNGESDFWVAKLDENYNILWSENLGGSLADVAQSMVETDDGGFILIGETDSEDQDVVCQPGRYIWAVKIDAQGQRCWDRKYGDYYWDKITKITKSADGGFICGGSSNDGTWWDGFNYWLFKINDTGDLEWEKFYGGSLSDELYDFQELPNGDIILVGYSESTDGLAAENYGEKDYWILRVNSVGEIIWQRTYGGTDWDEAHKVILTDDNHLLLTGQSSSTDLLFEQDEFSRTFWVTKMTLNGDIIWHHYLNAQRPNSNRGETYLAEALDGGYLVAAKGHQWPDNLSVFKITKNGHLQWETEIGGSGSEYIRGLFKNGDDKMTILASSTSSSGDIAAPRGGRDIWIFDLKERPNTQISLGADTIICAEAPIFFDVEIPQCIDCEYAWENGFDGPQRQINPTSTTTYQINITDQNGCNFFDNITVGVNDLSVDLDVSDTTCGDLENNIVALPTGGSGDYDFIWSNGSQENILQNIPNGSYSVTVSDGNCSQNESTNIGQLSAIGSVAAPNIEWSHRFNTSGFDQAYSAIFTNDNGMAIVWNKRPIWPYPDDSPDYGMTVVKFDNEDNIEWSSFFQGERNIDIIQLMNGGFLTSDKVLHPNGQIKLDLDTYNYSAEFEWTKDQSGGWLSATDRGFRIFSSEGGYDEGQTSYIPNSYYRAMKSVAYGNPPYYWLAGRYREDLYGLVDDLNYGGADGVVWKISENTIASEFNFGGTSDDEFNTIRKTADGGYICAGFSNSYDIDIEKNYGKNDFWVVKINNQGQKVWSKTYGGSEDDEAKTLEILPDGSYIVAGTTQSSDGLVHDFHGETDWWIINIDQNGELIWSKTIGGSGEDLIYKMDISGEGKILLSGESRSNNGDFVENEGETDAWIIRLGLPEVSQEIFHHDTTLCVGETLLLDAFQPNCDGCTYEWSNGNTNAQQTITISSTTTYEVSITNSDGCVLTDAMTVTALPTPPASITGVPTTTLCQEETITLNAEQLACPDCTYSWLDGSTDSIRNLTILKDTDFAVTITDQNGCTNSTEASVSVNDLNFSQNNLNDCGIELIPTGGTGNYQINWNNGETNSILTNLEAGTYPVTVSDGECELIDTIAKTPFQTADIDWEVDLNGGTAISMQHTSDGGIIAIGRGADFDKRFVVYKISPNHDIEWQYSVPNTRWSPGTCITETSDGGFLALGSGDNPQIVRLNADGTLKSNFSIPMNSMEFFSILPIENDEYLAAATNGYDAYVFKFNDTGKPIFSKSFGGNEDDTFNDLKKTNDGGYILTGSTRSDDGDLSMNRGAIDVWALKLNANLNVVWSKSFGTTTSDYGYASTPTADDGYAIIGRAGDDNWDASDNPYNFAGWLIKLDANGAVQWKKYFKYGWGSADILALPDGGLLVTAGSVIKMDADGNDEWILRDLNAFDAIAANDGGIIFNDAGRIFKMNGLKNWDTALLGEDIVSCYGGTLYLTQPETECASCDILWNDGYTAWDHPQFSYSQDTFISVTITDAFGCEYVDSLHIEVNSRPALTLEVLDAPTCDDPTAQLLAVAQNCEDCIYSWPHDESLTDSVATVTVLEPTYFYAIATNGITGCSKQSSTTLSLPELSANSHLDLSCGPMQSEAIVHPVYEGADTTSFTYQWSDGTMENTLINPPAGTYTVTINNADCTVVDTVEIAYQDTVVYNWNKPVLALQSKSYAWNLPEGYLLAENQDSAFSIKKYNLFGQVNFNQIIPIPNAQIATFDYLGNGEFILVAQANLNNNQDLQIIKIHESGTIIFSQNLLSLNDDYATKIQPYDGGFLIAGYKEKNYEQDALLIKTDADGNLIWEQTYGGISEEQFLDFQIDNNNDVIASGFARSKDGDVLENKGGKDAWITKIDTNGELLWSKTYGGDRDEIIYQSLIGSDGHLYFAASTNSADGDILNNFGNQTGTVTPDIWIFKLTENGNFVWDYKFGQINDVPVSLNEIEDEKIRITGIRQTTINCVYNFTVDQGWITTLNMNDGTGTHGQNFSIIYQILQHPSGFAAQRIENTFCSCIPSPSGSWPNCYTTTQQQFTGNYQTTTTLPTVDLGVDTTICNNENILLNAGEIDEFLYYWNTGEQTSDLLINAPGVYTVQVNNLLGCSVSDTIFIDLCDDYNLLMQNNLCETSEVVALFENGNYAWSNGSTEQSIVTDTAGWVYLNVTYGNGNVLTDSLYVDVYENNLNLEATLHDILCLDEPTGSIDLTVLNPTGVVTYNWSNGSQDSMISNLLAGNYYVTVTDEGGCTFDSTFTLFEPLPIDILPTVEHPSGGANNGLIELDIQGGTPPFTVNWDNGLTGAMIDNLEAGLYTATIIDANGCLQFIEVELTTILNNQDIDKLTDLTVSPNPFGNQFLVEMEVTNATIVEMAVYNLLGQQVSPIFSQQLNGLDHWSQSIQANDWAAGSYFLKIKIDEAVVVWKLVKNEG